MEIHIRGGGKGAAERAPFSSCRGAKSVGFLPNHHLVADFTLQKTCSFLLLLLSELEMTTPSEVLMPTHNYYFFMFFLVSPLGFKEQINIKIYNGTVFPDRLTATDALTR